MVKIPFFDVKRQYKMIEREVEEQVLKELRGGQYIEGPTVKEFEEVMSSYLGVRHVITCGNGTDALKIALKACGVEKADEVITTSFTFFATAEAIADLGAVPVFADIDPIYFNIDVDDVRRKITKATKAILAVHIFGMPAEMDKLNQIGKEYKIPVIEDACQAIGAEYKGEKTGTLGAIGCFSFYPTKNLGGFGDGGMITTNDDGLASICRGIKAHAAGRVGAVAFKQLYGDEVEELNLWENNKEQGEIYDPCKYYNYFIGQNSRLDSMQAAILLVKLKYLNQFNNRRREIATEYNRRLAGTPMVLPQLVCNDAKSCWHQYAVLVSDKENFLEYLNEHGIGAGSFYPVPMHLQKAFTELGYQPGSLTHAESVCNRSVCLPIFPELKDEEQCYIIDTILNYFHEES